jgi:hypothetical protein
MNDDKKSASDGRREPVRIPPELEREMLEAISQHRRVHGSRGYKDLRNRADFAPWIGTELGETGRKRFQRLVRVVAGPMAPDRTKRHRGREANEQQMNWASDQARRANAQSGIALSLAPEQVMAGGAMALSGFHELSQMLLNGPKDTELVKQAAFVDGKLVKPELLLAANKDQRAWAETIDRLSSRYASTFRTQEFAQRVMKLVFSVLADDPAKLNIALVGLNAIIADLNGLPATSTSAL